MMEEITSEVRQEVVENLAQLLLKNYPFPELAAKMAAHIRDVLNSGSYEDCKTSPELGRRLTDDLREISRDLHLAVFYDPGEAAQIVEKRSQDPLDEAYESDWWRWVHSDNFGLQKIEYLAGNIGYIDIRYFAPVNLAGHVAVAAMNFLSRCDALIFDLRQCGGGDPFMTQFLQSYLFDEHKKPKLLLTKYHPARDEVQQKWTYPYVPGERLPDIPVYILTSKRTFSGGEDMAYTLKHHDRATIVGETTGGGAHPVTELTPGDGFVVTLPEGYPIHPVTQSNWERIGVQPDIKVPREKALETAHRHEIQSLLEKSADPTRTHILNWYLQCLDAIYQPPVVDISLLKKYIGQYRDYEVKFRAGGLAMSRIGREDDWPMIPISENTFTADDDYNARFEIKEDGRVSALVWLGRDHEKEIRVARTGQISS